MDLEVCGNACVNAYQSTHTFSRIMKMVKKYWRKITESFTFGFTKELVGKSYTSGSHKI